MGIITTLESWPRVTGTLVHNSDLSTHYWTRTMFCFMFSTAWSFGLWIDRTMNWFVPLASKEPFYRPFSTSVQTYSFRSFCVCLNYVVVKIAPWAIIVIWQRGILAWWVGISPLVSKEPFHRPFSTFGLISSQPDYPGTMKTVWLCLLSNCV